MKQHNETWVEYVSKGLPASGMCRDCKFNSKGHCVVFDGPTTEMHPKFCKNNKYLIRGVE